MKLLKMPAHKITCPPSVCEDGGITVADFVRQYVLPRPAFRARGNAALVVEIVDWLANEGELSNASHELLQIEASFPEQTIRADLVRTVAEVQLWLSSARAADPGGA